MNAGSAKVRWSRRVDPEKIRRLYESDARGMLDEDLLNDVGYGIYVCCVECLELGEATRGRVKCCACGHVIARRLVDGQFDDSEVLRCGECGWEVWCGDYHKSLLRKAPAPPYEPDQVFESYVEQWPLARSPRAKLLLIDRLIHEWHIHYRAVGWPLGTSVVRATARQMVDLLEGLAYGFGTTEGLEQTRVVWRARLEAKRMGFDLKAAARDLGIKGISRMRKRELIEAIERADPQFFRPWRDLVYGVQWTPTEGEVGSEHMDACSAYRLIATLERRIPEWMAQANVVGLSVALVQDAQGTGHPTVAWKRGFGLKNATTGEPVTPETVFEAASLSKPVFAYAVLKACAEGLLDLEAPLSTYLPEPYIPDDPRLHRITARHVLSHTPGFPNWRPKDQPLRIHFPAGERFAYSGEGYVYLQRVVEHLSGQPLDAWMRARLLDSLGMHRSSYVWIDAYETQAAHGHDEEGKTKELRKMREPNAAYSLYTTPSEFARFVTVLLQPPDDPACLTADQVNHMLDPQISVNDAGLDAERPTSEVRADERVSWGLGWALQHTPDGDAFWHWGDNGDFQAFVMGFPRQKTGMVCMANSKSGRALWADLFDLAYGAGQPALAWLSSLYGDGETGQEQETSTQAEEQGVERQADPR